METQHAYCLRLQNGLEYYNKILKLKGSKIPRLSKSVLTPICLTFETFAHIQIRIDLYLILLTGFLTSYEFEFYIGYVL